MNLPDEFKFFTLGEMLERRAEILRRPFPRGYSGDERLMMDLIEMHCTSHFMPLLAVAKKAATVIKQLGCEPSLEMKRILAECEEVMP